MLLQRCWIADGTRLGSDEGARLADHVNLPGKNKTSGRRGRSSTISIFYLIQPNSEIYFLSSVGVEFEGVDGVLGVFVGLSPSRIPSLKLFTPAPNPRIISGIFLPPKKSTITRRITSKCHGAKPSINHLLSMFPRPRHSA